MLVMLAFIKQVFFYGYVKKEEEKKENPNWSS